MLKRFVVCCNKLNVLTDCICFRVLSTWQTALFRWFTWCISEVIANCGISFVNSMRAFRFAALVTQRCILGGRLESETYADSNSTDAQDVAPDCEEAVALLSECSTLLFGEGHIKCPTETMRSSSCCCAGTIEEPKYPRAEVGCVWVDLLHQTAMACLQNATPEVLPVLQEIMSGPQGLVACCSLGDFPQLQQIMQSDSQIIPAQTTLVKLARWAESLLCHLTEWAKMCQDQSASNDTSENPLNNWLRIGLKLVMSESVGVAQQGLTQLEASIDDRLCAVKDKVQDSLLKLERSLQVCCLPPRLLTTLISVVLSRTTSQVQLMQKHPMQMSPVPAKSALALSSRL